MGLFLIVLSFISFFLILNNKKGLDIVSSFIYSIIGISVLILISTELLSPFNGFNYKSLLVFWIITTISLIGYVIKAKIQLSTTSNEFIQLIKRNKKFAIGLFSLLIVLFAQGLIYPPNNWDSMTYHLGRIVHWVANRNVDSYPTHIYRQVYDQPFAEFFMAQVCILNKADWFASSVQLLFMLGSLGAIISICKEFTFSKKAIYLSVIFACTTPEILLESTSTQNDIVVSFFVITAILFGIRTYKEDAISNFFLFGLTSGLAIFTKGTAYIYLPFAFLFFGVFYLLKVVKGRNYGSLLKIAIIPTVIILINLGYYYRNYKLTHDIFGKYNDVYFNESMNAKKAFLLVVKNFGLQFGVAPFNGITDSIVKNLHQYLGEDMGDPKNNSTPFAVEEFNHHEDKASNIIQAILIMVSIVLFVKYKQYRTISVLLIIFPCLEFILFSLVFKYEPWHIRRQISVFFMFAIPAGYVISKGIKESVFLKILVAQMITYAVYIILVNPTRPFTPCGLTDDITIYDKRDYKFVASRYYDPLTYREVKRFIEEKHREQQNVGIFMSGNRDTWEYPLYYDIFNDPEKWVAPHINVNNPSKNATWNEVFDKNKITYILGDSKVDSILYNGYCYKKEGALHEFTVYKKLASR